MPKEVDKRFITPEAIEKLKRTVLNLFADNLFHDIGIRDICKQAGVEQDLQRLTNSAVTHVRSAKTFSLALGEMDHLGEVK